MKNARFLFQIDIFDRLQNDEKTQFSFFPLCMK